MKTLHIFNVDNAIDIITNSSSELFILNGQSTEMVNGMIESVYPDYRNEYEEVVALKYASPDQISTYMSWIENPWHSDWRSERNMSKEDKRARDIQKAEARAAKFGMKPSLFYANWKDRNDSDWWYANISDRGLRKAAEHLDPDGTIFMLFSLDENPNWDYQEKLSDIGQRYHLG